LGTSLGNFQSELFSESIPKSFLGDSKDSYPFDSSDKLAGDIPITATPKIQKKLIILSIDGFPGYYLEDDYIMKDLPNLSLFFSKSHGGRVKTVNPSLTYPSHTSMITGVDPGIHGIEGNRPIDPFYLEDGAWLWYDEDRKVKNIIDFAKQAQLRTASVFWPVSVGNFSDYNIPQIWRTKTEGDTKLIRALATSGLHEEMESLVGEPVLETTGDSAKIRTGISIFQEKNPDITLIYSTDVDTHHHLYGPYSKVALNTLKKADSLVGELIKKTKLYERDDLGLIVVSDHGFLTAKKICRPNRLLVDMGYINTQNKTWDFYFQSSAGMASLVGNPNTRLGKRKFPKLVSLKKRLENTCPGIKFHYNNSYFQERKRNSHPTSQAILETNKSIYISATYNGAYFEKDNGLHVHGFPNEFSEMDTILFFYEGKSSSVSKVKKEYKSVKDTFDVACEWLDIKCKKGERR
jgi:hypothetical protein